MAKLDSAEKADVMSEQESMILPDEQGIEPTDVMTGDRNHKRFLYYQLKMSLMKAKRIDIIVSFLMESGVRMILDDFRAAQILEKLA